MTRPTSPRSSHAVSEVIGALLLVAMALAAFAVIYTRVFPLPLPTPETNVKLAGFINESHAAALQHVGGETITTYDIIVTQSDGRHVYHYADQPWEMGQCLYPPMNASLFEEERAVNVTVVNYEPDGGTRIIFEGTLRPKDEIPGPLPPQFEDPMTISTLRTNTMDEDLICYSYTIEPTITPKTYIYNWLVKTSLGSTFNPFARLLLPFDSPSAVITKDYSGLHNNGTVSGATWTNAGKMGGAYKFVGHQFITIPYCLVTPTAAQLTIEAWVKTNQTSGTILSYNRTNYCELAISDGHVKWSTTSSDGTSDLSGIRLINDNAWHLITVTYNATTGVGQIFINGTLDRSLQVHGANKLLGNGMMPQGKIGMGSGLATRSTIFSTGFEATSEANYWHEQNSTGSLSWTNIRLDNFNTGWGNYLPGSNGSQADALRSNSYKYEGTYSAEIKDNSGVGSSFRLTTPIDMDSPAYKSLKIDFWWMWRGSSWSSGKYWYLEYYNGTAWGTIMTLSYPFTGYTSGTFYHQIVYVNESNYRFPPNMLIRFTCHGTGDNCQVYIDKVYLNVTSYGRVESDFGLLPTTTMTPHSGSSSLGGSGDFDPEVDYYNRTAIDLTGYKNKILTFWYSYKNTKTTDCFGLFYKNNSVWTPIYNASTPSSSGQTGWTQVSFNIPQSITSLKLQFRWRSSAINEYIAIDDLQITGIPLGGESNFTGTIDEVKIYPSELSPEQCYQNYLCTFQGNSSRSVLVSESLMLGQNWKCFVTPNDGSMDDLVVESNTLTIISYPGGD